MDSGVIKAQAPATWLRPAVLDRAEQVIIVLL